MDVLTRPLDEQARELPLPEREGWLIFVREQRLLGFFVKLGWLASGPTPKRAFLIETFRQGPEATVAATSRALGIPAGTVRAWRARDPGFAAALSYVEGGQLALLRDIAQATGKEREVLWDLFQGWPVPRGARVWGEAARDGVEHPDSDRAFHAQLMAYVGISEPFEPPKAEDFMSAEQEAGLFRLADAHHAFCDPPCTERPHPAPERKEPRP